VVFIESRPFTRKLYQLAGDRADGVLTSIQKDLDSKPERGAVLSRSRDGPGARRRPKSARRQSKPRQGQAGGYRYLYLYLKQKQHIHLLVLLDKNEQEDVTEEQRRQIREWVAQVKKNSGG
jgi:hypothetical protein